MCVHLAAENSHGGDQQRDVTRERVDRQADRGERQRQRRQLSPAAAGGGCLLARYRPMADDSPVPKTALPSMAAGHGDGLAMPTAAPIPAPGTRVPASLFNRYPASGIAR